jgi:hypothetical protein
MAREAALANNPARTLRLLDAYQREFPRGDLGPEAKVLRIEALAKSGRKDEAAAIARAFLHADPSSPHAERIRALLSPASSP